MDILRSQRHMAFVEIHGCAEGSLLHIGCKSDGPVRMYAIRQTLTHANLKG